MSNPILGYGIQYGGYVLELTLLALILKSGQWRRWRGVCLYLLLLLSVDAVGRPLVLHKYGVSSGQYEYFYWLSDVLLTLGAFLLVCSLFRRACAGQEKMWNLLVPSLGAVFALVLGISLASLFEHYKNLLSIFMFEFQQNLYFACLVLNTLLYILLQRLESVDEALSLTVCGLGIQFAGPAANFALVHLAQGNQSSQAIYAYLGPFCTIGMLATWLYVAVRGPQRAKVPGEEKIPAWADSALPS
jgi:hypothetical protein